MLPWREISSIVESPREVVRILKPLLTSALTKLSGFEDSHQQFKSHVFRAKNLKLQASHKHPKINSSTSNINQPETGTALQHLTDGKHKT